MNNKLTWVIILLTLILTLFLRVIFLSQSPPGLANDEVNIIMNAQSLLHTGQNIPGVVTGIVGHSAGEISGGVHSELSSFFIIPSIVIFGFNWPGVKFTFALFSLGIVLLSYLLAKRLINQQTGLIAMLLSAINPWLIFFGRSAYESILSSFFYLLALYVFVSRKGWRVLFSLPIFLLGFFCYFSAKTLLLPLSLICLIYVLVNKDKKTLVPVIVLNIFVVIFLLLYSLILASSPASRFNELKNTRLTDTVNYARKTSVNFGFNNLFENKITEDIKTRLTASLNGLSLGYIFINGQPESIPSLQLPFHGWLYVIDLPFVLLGLIFLKQSKPKSALLFLLLIASTLLPNFLNLQGTTYTIRTVILFPVLVLISAAGIFYLNQLIKLPKLKIAGAVLIGLTYLFVFGNFFYQYFSRMPIEKADGWFLKDRIATSYIKNYNIDSPVVVLSTSPKFFFYRYLFFSGLYKNTGQVDSINQKLKEKDYTLANVKIQNNCPKALDPNTTYIIDPDLKCGISSKIVIASIKDAGTLYQIYNDKLCKNLAIRRYPYITNINDLNTEKLSKEELCNKFVTNLDVP